MERSGYLPTLRAIAKSFCAPFWWHGTDSKDQYRVFHNGTVCFLDTGSHLIGVTACHVYDEYLRHKQEQADLVCQFGSSTIEPESRLIARSQELDLATFELSSIVIGASGANAHAPVAWPTNRVTASDVLLYGGFPGSLRVEGLVTAELPFQWFAGAPISVTPGNIKLHLDLKNFRQPLTTDPLSNLELGGMSGGPVFRVISAPPVERLELVGFIFESQMGLELVYARPAHCITSSGTMDFDAAA